CWSLSMTLQHIIGLRQSRGRGGLPSPLYTYPAMSQELRSMLEDYRHLFDANPSPMLIYARDSLELLAVNDSLLASLGYAREELVGKSLLVLHPEEDREQVRAMLGP